MAFDPPTVAQAIEVLGRYRPGMTPLEIARALFGDDDDPQRVNKARPAPLAGHCPQIQPLRRRAGL